MAGELRGRGRGGFASINITPLVDVMLVLVTVTKDEKILFGEKDVTASIEDELRTNERVQKESELYIRADKDARYGIVAKVVAAARSSGVKSLNLLVQPELEEDTSPPENAALDKATPQKAGGKHK